MAIQVNGTEVISNSRALNNIASVDATTVAALTAAGVGGPAEKSWENIGTINYGTRSNGVNVSEYWTLPSKYQNGFSGDVMLYGTATRINQSGGGDTQYSDFYFGDHSFIGTGNGTDLLNWRAAVNYYWPNGGSRDMTDVKFWFSKKLLVSSGETFFSSDTGPSGLEINGSGWSGWTDFPGEDSNLQAPVRNAQKRTSSNGNSFSCQNISTQKNSWIPANDSSWNRRIYSDFKTQELQWTNFTLTLYINSDV